MKKNNFELKKDSLRVYLAGTITTEDPYFTEWRAKASEYLRANGIIPLSPMAKKELNTSNDGGITSSIPNSAVFMRDHAMVKSAHILLVNLKVKGYSGIPIKKPLIGSFFEMAWAWQYQKPIIAVVEEDNYLYQNHPFITETITHKFSTLEEALENIVTYWNWHYQARFGES
jgi:nucleoside 2-deoxyribosyltransferase